MRKILSIVGLSILLMSCNSNAESNSSYTTELKGAATSEGTDSVQNSPIEQNEE
jgi:hypothetical protein